MYNGERNKDVRLFCSPTISYRRYILSPSQKKNLILNMIYSNTMNLDKCMSRFIALGCVTFNTGLVFYGTDRVYDFI